MKALRCERWMPFVDVPVVDLPSPPLGEGEVRIAIHYAGVSFATSLVTEGKYQRKPPLPFTPGTEIAGVIAEVGANATGFAVGDRVCAGIDWGGHAEEVCVDPTTVYRLPDGFPLDVAPQFPLSYATSYAALVWRAAVKPGETVLVHGSAGAVGLAAVEIAKAMGCYVVATASTAEKRALVAAHGADVVLPLPASPGGPDARESILAAIPRGADVIYDPIGGDVFDLSLRCVANSGRILVIGFAGGRAQQVPGNIILVKDVSVLGFNYGNYIGWGRVDERKRHEPEVRAMFDRLFGWVMEGKLKPTSSHRFPLDQTRRAMETVLARQSMGKVVLAMPVAG